MKNFISLKVESRHNQQQIYKLVGNEFPEFNWRQGDSDAQGEYLSGMSSESIQIQIWLDNGFVDTTVSFRALNLSDDQKEKLINRLEHGVLLHLGKSLDRKECD